MTLAYCSLFSTLIPVMVGIINWRKLMIAFKVFIGFYTVYFALFAATFILGETGNDLISKLSDINATFTYSSLMYFSISNKQFKKIIFLSSMTVILIGVINIILKFVIKSDLLFHSNPIGNIFNITLITIFLTRMFFKLRNINLSKNTIFIILISILIPASYSFLYEAFSEILISENVKVYIILYGTSFIIYTLRNFVFAYCILNSKNILPFKNL
jgi:hypothetical protein